MCGIVARPAFVGRLDMRRVCVPAVLAGWISVIFLAVTVREVAAGEGLQLARSDYTTVFGYYGVTHGNSHRRFTTAWGNAYFAGGLGTHAEAHVMDREDTAAFFAGGLSWSNDRAEIRGWVGTSTDNVNTLPEVYARLDASYSSPSEWGFVFRPALTYREFRNGTEEIIGEFEIAKYVSLETGYLVFTAMARGLAIDPGRHISGAFGAGVLYAQSGKVSVGIGIEGGRASYDGLLGPGELDEPYVTIRPSVSFYLTEGLELVGMMEYSSRRSYDLYGGHIGLKFRFD